MRNTILDNAVILITGASSGIGRELAKQLAPRARAIILVAQKKDKLDELANELKMKNQNLEIIVEPCDLSRQEEIDRVLDSVTKRINVDVLINNAGMGNISLFEKSDWQNDLYMINLNVIGLTKITHRLLPMMVERKKGGIINIASGSSFISVPGAAVYNATKAYIHGFNESLVMELAGTDVVVTEVCPGPISFPAMDKMQGQTNQEGYHPLKISPSQVACEIIRGFESKQMVVYPGFLYRWSMYLASFIPHFAVRSMGKGVAYWARRNNALENK